MTPIQLEDFLQYHALSDVQVSPSGKHAAFALSKANALQDGYETALYLLDTTTQAYQQLTAFSKQYVFQWLDETTLIFLSSRDEKIKEKVEAGQQWSEFYTISITGGEATQLDTVPLKVLDFKVLNTSQLILTCFFDNNRPEIEQLEKQEQADALQKLKEEKDYEILEEIPYWQNGVGFTSGKRSRLYLLNLLDHTVVPISAPMEDAALQDFTDNKILYTCTLFVGKKDLTDSLVAYDITTNTHDILIKQGQYSISDAGFIQDKIYFSGTDMQRFGLNENPSHFLLEDKNILPWADLDVSGWNSVGSDVRLGAGKNKAVVDDILYFITTEGTSSHIRALSLTGDSWLVTKPEGSVDCFDVWGDCFYYIGLRNMRLQELYLLEEQTQTQLSSFNEAVFKNKNVLAPKYFEFKNDATLLDGFVIEPAGYDETKTYPAILTIHGGPKTVYGNVFMHEMQLWANMGYFVVYTNPRGSDGKGNVFADIRGKYGMIDFDDLMAFMDLVEEKYPQIDKNRVGVTGGSYGGYMTNWIIGHTQRFACAASQRSISNFISKSYTTDIGYYFGKDQTGTDAWQDAEKMWWHSPLKYADQAKTPTLFIHSDEDYRCWLPEALQMFTALKYFGVEAKLCLFHQENHELSRSGMPRHRIKRLAEITNWFEKYLK